MSFKLLAIKPLEGCDNIFLKNLKEGETYKFYQNSIDHENYNNENHLDIYSTSNININVSAVVGENGSGKSSLVDFFNAINYYLSCFHFKTINSTDKTLEIQIRDLFKFTKRFIDELKDELNSDSFLFDIPSDFNIDLSDLDEEKISIQFLNYFEKLTKKDEKVFKNESEASKKIKKLQDDSVYYLYEYLSDSNCIQEIFWSGIDKIKEKLIRLPKNLNQERKFNNKIQNQFNFELYYENNDTIEKIVKIGNKTTLTDESFFYSILLNYSLHSLNSTVMGGWIHSLFHKNDGYQTPLVINPYREEGIININKEKKLSIDRLVYNIIENLNLTKDSTILNKYRFNKFILKLKLNNRQPWKLIDFDIRNENTFLHFLSNHIYELEIYGSNKNILDYVFGYLWRKFEKISNTYMPFFYNFDYSEIINPNDWKKEKAVEFILKNKKSHVTRKFYQSYNFLKNYKKYTEKLDFINHWNLEDEIELTKENLIEWIDFIKDEILTGQDKIITEDILVNLFPTIFDIDIEFLIDKAPIKLSDMSSGEQQYIFNISTIVYHINNLKTIKENEDTKIKSYQNVNIILDEIELYYHPQFQKNLVKDITKSIQEIQGLDKLTNFNILFLTHSPFILSDIPSDNVLKLKAGIPENSINEKTFGANIHDLLHNDFFLQDGFMGEFAREKINEIIHFLTYKKIQNQIKNKQVEIIQIKNLLDRNSNDNYRIDLERKLKDIKYSINSLKKQSNETKPLKKFSEDYCKKIIEIVGEPILYFSLMEIYCEAFPTSKDNYIETQLKKLKNKNVL
ncbi:ATP-binding protein [Flavobacterium sp. H122]|uniref:ATP-binding protein n=1 Tax=Flavobacterium sp. H122 TaxID=2529860 RepID=UPI0010AB0892|nr:ATP-binding protein [Flavobacterium sp. H122]